MTNEQKRSDFLWIVQMIMSQYREKITGWSGFSGDAVAASYQIPADLTAREAALDFCGMVVPGFADEDGKRIVPKWIRPFEI